jgi:hypothetical protein
MLSQADWRVAYWVDRLQLSFGVRRTVRHSAFVIHMSWRVVGLVVVAVVFAVVGLGSTVVLIAMVDDVNRTRAREDWISPYGWYPGKQQRVVRAYREAYPAGRRHVRLYLLALVGGIAGVLGAVCILLPD